MTTLSAFKEVLDMHFQERGVVHLALNELTLEIYPSHYLSILKELKDKFHFESLIDLCGVDYSTYDNYSGNRFAVILHLLSVSQNKRLRVKTILENDTNPRIESVTSIWPAANWYEREAYDLLGITFDNHPDLRRILTDYDFVGHPLRKDFPQQGYVEVVYDKDKQSIVLQPTTISPREIPPRIIRGRP